MNWADAHVPDLRASFAAERAEIAHLCAPDVRIDDHMFCTGGGLVFTPPAPAADDIL